MSILILMIPMSLLLGLCAVLGFIWAVRDHQLEDTETPAYRILIDEKENQR